MRGIRAAVEASFAEGEPRRSPARARDCRPSSAGHTIRGGSPFRVSARAPARGPSSGRGDLHEGKRHRQVRLDDEEGWGTEKAGSWVTDESGDFVAEVGLVVRRQHEQERVLVSRWQVLRTDREGLPRGAGSLLEGRLRLGGRDRSEGGGGQRWERGPRQEQREDPASTSQVPAPVPMPQQANARGGRLDGALGVVLPEHRAESAQLDRGGLVDDRGERSEDHRTSEGVAPGAPNSPPRFADSLANQLNFPEGARIEYKYVVLEDQNWTKQDDEAAEGLVPLYRPSGDVTEPVTEAIVRKMAIVAWQPGPNLVYTVPSQRDAAGDEGTGETFLDEDKVTEIPITEKLDFYNP